MKPFKITWQFGTKYVKEESVMRELESLGLNTTHDQLLLSG